MIENTSLQIDFGSGYNPKLGYKTCDITYSPILDYVYDENTNKIIGLEEQTVTEFRLKNVLHHSNIEQIAKCLFKYLKTNGIVCIIEPLPEFYNTNRCLDIFWYRYIYPRYEINLPPIQRIDYTKIFSKLFIEIEHYKEDVYDVYVYKKIN